MIDRSLCPVWRTLINTKAVTEPSHIEETKILSTSQWTEQQRIGSLLRFNTFFFFFCTESLFQRGGFLYLWSAGFSLWSFLLLHSTGSRAWAQWLWYMGLVACSIWDLTESGMEPMSPALAGGVWTTGSPGKSFAFTTAGIWMLRCTTEKQNQ